MAYEVTVLGRQVTNSAAGVTINEVSGYAHSRAHSNLIWGAEDAPEGFFIYGFAHSGSIRHIIKLAGPNLSQGQWEDMAYDDLNGYMWVANCGNNGAQAARAQFNAYRFREPTTLAGNSVVNLTHSGVFRFEWDGFESTGRDCETMLVSPTTGRLYFVNKETQDTGLRTDIVGMWAAPVNLAPYPAVNKLTRITPTNWLPRPAIAGGDWARDNHAIYLMNNTTSGWKISPSGPSHPLIENFTIRQPVRNNGSVGTSESLAVSSDCTYLIRGSEGPGPEILRAELDNGPANPEFPTFVAKRGSAILAVKRS